MRRFFVSPQEIKESQVQLEGDEFHHLKNVCRLEEGERVELLDGAGHIALAEITSIGKKSASLAVQNLTEAPPPPIPQIDIVLCVPRFQKMDLIIQKCVELGAAQITPVVSERSFVKTLSKDLSGKVSRWRKIASEACKQSGRAWPLQLLEPETLSSQMKKASHETSLFLYEGEGAADIKTALQDLGPAKPQRMTLFIGAEGGFSVKELSDFKSLNFRPITLGNLVLRVETACIAILSVIQYHFDLMR